jgi:hypothetical protein
VKEIILYMSAAYSSPIYRYNRTNMTPNPVIERPDQPRFWPDHLIPGTKIDDNRISSSMEKCNVYTWQEIWISEL